MNRKMNGEHFTRAELVAMAVGIGAIEPGKVSSDMKTHVFEDLTREHRMAMFMRGEAVLNTRPRPAKPGKSLTVDREMVAFLGGTV